MKIFLIYIAIISIYAFGQMGRDKARAVRGNYRIPERNLFLGAALGGSIGSILGMIVFRHKIRKRKFILGMPAILLAQIGIFLLVLRFLHR